MSAMADNTFSDSAERAVSVYIDSIVVAAKEAERAQILADVRRRADGYRRGGECADGDAMILNERLAATYALDLVAHDLSREES